MPVIVVVIAGAAADFGGLIADNGDDCVVGQSFALHAKIVDYITKTDFAHTLLPAV
jgi:hypothetical protein